MQYYTVLFGVSRAFGVAAQLIWDRALGAREHCIFCVKGESTVLIYTSQPSSVPNRTRQTLFTKFSRTRTRPLAAVAEGSLWVASML